MTASSNYDVIIIGAGSVGTPAALNLAERGTRVLVLDSEASAGQGSNKKAIGGVRATHSDPAKIRLCLRSLEILSTWQETWGDNLEWHKGGYAFVAYREREEKTLKDLLVIQKSFGLSIDWLERDDFLKAIPDLNPEGLIGGTLSPDDGHCSPLLTAHAYYAHSRRAGATFRFREPVSEILIERGKIRGVKTSQGTYAAPVVMNAAGAYAEHVAQMAGLHVPVRPDSHEAAITEPVAHFLDPMVVDIRPATGSTNYYFYQHHTGQLIFCITPSPQIWGDDSRETSEFLPMVARRMVDVMPRLVNIRIRRTWRGLYPMTPDGSPIVGWAREVDGFLQAVGMCGQGFMLGPGLGELLARLVLHEETQDDCETLQVLSPYREFEGQEKLK